MHTLIANIVGLAMNAGVMAVVNVELVQNNFAAEVTEKVEKPNPQMQAALDEIAILGPKPLGAVPVVEARKQPSPADAVKILLKKQGKSIEPEVVGKVENKKIAGAVDQIPIRIYTPKGQGPFPVIVYYHGSGWVIADLDTYDASPRALTNATNAVVISAHYRQAPELKFPAAHDNALAAYNWVLENAKELNGDPKKIALVGESAGGNMAAGVSITAREHQMQMPVYQALVYPVAGDNVDTPSYIENAIAKPLNRASM